RDRVTQLVAGLYVSSVQVLHVLYGVGQVRTPDRNGRGGLIIAIGWVEQRMRHGGCVLHLRHGVSVYGDGKRQRWQVLAGRYLRVIEARHLLADGLARPSIAGSRDKGQ